MTYRPARLGRPFGRALPPLFFPFAPKDAPGFVAQWRADQGIVLASGRVASWSDQVSGELALQLTAAVQPVPATGINGRASVSFDGTTALAVEENFLNAGAKTIAMVRRFSSYPTGTNIVTALSLIAPSGVTGTRIQYAGTSFPAGILFEDDATGVPGSMPSGVGATDTAAHVDYIEYLGGTVTDPTQYHYFLDGLSQTVSSGPFGAFSPADSSSIGARLVAGVVSMGAAVDIAEIDIYTTNLTQALRNKLSGYYQTRYGIIMADATF